jgi:hypothetical protein
MSPEWKRDFMMVKARRHVFVFSVLSLAFASGVAGQAFDAKPLRTPIAFPVDSMQTTWPAFRSWLQEAPPSTLQAHLAQVREHLYALISANAKERTVAGEPPLPPEGDSALAELFDWGDCLGIPGAALVGAKLRSQAEPPSTRTPATPDFAIRFDSLYTVTAKADDWTIRFPYYFMIGSVTRQKAANGAETSAVMLSTLFARDSTTVPGASQATILVLSAQVPPPAITEFWLSLIGLAPSDTMKTPTPLAVAAYGGRDARLRMNRELVVYASPRGTILFIYTGLDGSYEANRPHFIDLMNTLRIGGN